MKQVTLRRPELPYEIAEEIKSLRTNIRFCGDDKRVIMMTSCISGEGKSTLSLQLASSIAELGFKTVLVDTDLRKSQLEKQAVNSKFGQGVTHYLAGQCPLEDALYFSGISGLFVMPAGAVPPHPSELLASGRMDNLLRELRATFDYIIVDCAPLGLVVDAAVVAPRCDGSILVIEADSISYHFAQEVSAKLKNAQCPVLGAVLNKVNREHGKYYGYGKYYGKKYEEYYYK